VNGAVTPHAGFYRRAHLPGIRNVTAPGSSLARGFAYFERELLSGMFVDSEYRHIGAFSRK
jgi:hypothetical protein